MSDDAGFGIGDDDYSLDQDDFLEVKEDDAVLHEYLQITTYASDGCENQLKIFCVLNNQCAKWAPSEADSYTLSSAVFHASNSRFEIATYIKDTDCVGDMLSQTAFIGPGACSNFDLYGYVGQNVNSFNFEFVDECSSNAVVIPTQSQYYIQPKIELKETFSNSLPASTLFFAAIFVMFVVAAFIRMSTKRVYYSLITDETTSNIEHGDVDKDNGEILFVETRLPVVDNSTITSSGDYQSIA